MVSGQHQDGGEKGNTEGTMHPALPCGLAAAAPCFPALLSHTKLGVGFFKSISFGCKVGSVFQVVLSVKLLAWGFFFVDNHQHWLNHTENESEMAFWVNSEGWEEASC